jgi:hypothetical protein
MRAGMPLDTSSVPPTGVGPANSSYRKPEFLREGDSLGSRLDRKFNPDEPSPYAPKWVHDAAQSERRTDAAVFEGTKADEFQSPVNPLGPDNGMLLVEGYPVPRSLEPTMMRGPSYPRVRTRFGIRLLVRFGGAATVAASVALLVVGEFPRLRTIAAHGQFNRILTLGSRFVDELIGKSSTSAVVDQPRSPAPQLIVIGHAGPHGRDEASPLGLAVGAASAGAVVVIDGLATGSTLNVGRSAGSSAWRLMAGDLHNAVIRPPQNFVGAMDLAIALRLADDSVADRKTVRLQWTAPVTTATQSMETRFVFQNLDRDEIDTLVKRGEDFIARGDIAAARLVLQRAAEGNDAGAALTLAETYDPVVLEKLGVQGLSADIAKARTWYERAKDLGSPEARRRLELLEHFPGRSNREGSPLFA